MDEKEQALRLVAVVGEEKQGFPPSPLLGINASVSGEAYLTEKTLIINDYPSHPKALPPVVEAGMKSMFILPIKVGGRVLGTLNIDSWELNHFTPERVRHITAVGDGLGALLENARLREGERLRTQELEAQFNIAKILVQEGSFKEKVTRVLGELVQVAQGDLATLRVADEKEQGLRLVAAVGEEKQEVPLRPVVPYNEGIVGPTYLTGELAVINDYPSHPMARPHVIAAGLRSMMIIPAQVSGRMLGILTINSM